MPTDPWHELCPDAPSTLPPPDFLSYHLPHCLLWLAVMAALEANDERTSAGQRASRRNDDARSVIGYAPSESERDARCEARARARRTLFRTPFPAPT